METTLNTQSPPDQPQEAPAPQPAPEKVRLVNLRRPDGSIAKDVPLSETQVPEYPGSSTLLSGIPVILETKDGISTVALKVKVPQPDGSFVEQTWLLTWVNGKPEWALPPDPDTSKQPTPESAKAVTHPKYKELLRITEAERLLFTRNGGAFFVAVQDGTGKVTVLKDYITGHPALISNSVLSEIIARPGLINTINELMPIEDVSTITRLRFAFAGTTIPKATNDESGTIQWLLLDKVLTESAGDIFAGNEIDPNNPADQISWMASVASQQSADTQRFDPDPPEVPIIGTPAEMEMYRISDEISGLGKKIVESIVNNPVLQFVQQVPIDAHAASRTLGDATGIPREIGDIAGDASRIEMYLLGIKTAFLVVAVELSRRTRSSAPMAIFSAAAVGLDYSIMAADWVRNAPVVLWQTALETFTLLATGLKVRLQR
ncbi:hypothetical protein A3D00_01555 [Candidatus Woesebacteria bacterium RIFCSPHIGHO2_02_FULL_38_9]|uniref:Uncharacterized protein n=1 Tax=Candidatus Woesebacteria bacterium RIFCSPHIGHO2_01_FULL_39_28 TaxID=1802496 RepID=A0A1F7YIU2_9BACT|nr:MAG: hypothetical protein A2627_03340 [Candidatus Woesebacteria bacterium RIFCSPHIGHO2_01_FULL_39_28]OGM31642.1 MAG: hypothetical protein A3D00_01555 [Candidatus Woesebacteria bacterium RIFCSPHIGHO2_02_FULL_38_9]OGM56965.1 MAG: hypothetical protein A3A50_03685 [Candidatus Woesebacteria bacterium RIFCSPLOWO2_01_FULL_38_20]